MEVHTTFSAFITFPIHAGGGISLQEIHHLMLRGVCLISFKNQRLPADMDFSRASGLRKRNLQFKIQTSYGAMPRDRMRRSTSDLSSYFGSGSSLNSGSSDSSNSSPSNPSTPVSSESTNISPEQKAKMKMEGKPGFRSLLAEDAQPVQNKNIILGHQLKVDVANASSLSSVTNKINPKASILHKSFNPSAKISKTPGPAEFSSREIGKGFKLRDEPCIFAPISEPSEPPSVSLNLIVKPDSVPASKIRGHAIISPDGNPCFRPLTFCTVHKCSGFLRLEEIKKSESYTRVEVNQPNFTKVTHMYNNCVLEFPPTDHQLIVFKDNKKYDNSPPSPPPPRVKVPGPSWSQNPQLQDNFLKYCLNCYKLLYKKNVYMYRGDAWFCCAECRYFNTKEGKEEANKEMAVKAKIERESCPNSTQASPSKNKGKYFF